MIVSSEVPRDLADKIRMNVAEVVGNSRTTRFALRSSALSEDDLLTFAGQYRSLLNVRGNEVVERYREILAGKFTPKAIFYLLSHAFRESDLAMCVGCISMVEQRKGDERITWNERMARGDIIPGGLDAQGK